MHSRLSRVLLSCRCLYGPLEAAKLGLCESSFAKELYAHLVPRNALTHSHQSLAVETRTQTIGAAAELSSSMHRQ